MFKKIIKIVGAVLTVIACTFYLVFLRRHTDGETGSGIDERDSRIEEGITECEGRTESISNRIERANNATSRCEEHLRRAEEILQEAINKSKDK